MRMAGRVKTQHHPACASAGRTSQEHVVNQKYWPVGQPLALGSIQETVTTHPGNWSVCVNSVILVFYVKQVLKSWLCILVLFK